jgi:hypothetical protein
MENSHHSYKKKLPDLGWSGRRKEGGKVCYFLYDAANQIVPSISKNLPVNCVHGKIDGGRNVCAVDCGCARLS